MRLDRDGECRAFGADVGGLGRLWAFKGRCVLSRWAVREGHWERSLSGLGQSAVLRSRARGKLANRPASLHSLYLHAHRITSPHLHEPTRLPSRFVPTTHTYINQAIRPFCYQGVILSLRHAVTVLS
jgi:hypothetical protein